MTKRPLCAPCVHKIALFKPKYGGLLDVMPFVSVPRLTFVESIDAKMERGAFEVKEK